MNASEMRPAARRARLVMLVLLLAAGLAAAPRANALLGGLIGGEGGGCGADDGGLLGGIGGLADGGGTGGCPLVESEPLLVEGMIRKQEIELALQTTHMVTQIENMIKMRRLAGLDTTAEIVGAIRDARRVAGLVEGVLWDLSEVDAAFRDLYPEVLPEGMTAEALAAHQAEQARLARASSRASKLVTADAMTGLEAYTARAGGIASAVKACEGQTCAIDAATQAVLFTAELGSRLLAMQAAHYRAVEAQLDYEQAAVERARQHMLINWRGLTSYGGSGS